MAQRNGPSWVESLNSRTPEQQRADQEKLNEMKVKFENDRIGALTGYDCPTCRNKGWVYFLQEGQVTAQRCKCMVRRRTLDRLKKSGMEGLISRLTFDTFETRESWQRTAKSIAMRYAEEPAGWFLASGAVGAGKTHLCTAICGSLIEAGKDVRYMLWTQDAKALKRDVMNSDVYDAMMDPFKKVQVLYIDDFFKAGRDPTGRPKVTEADISLAHELLNHRYNNRSLITIISTELDIREIMDIDAAVGSRIYEMSKNGNILSFTGNDKNYRLKGS